MKLHFKHWPKRKPISLTIPKTTMDHNLEVSAQRYPDKTAIFYYGTTITYEQLFEQVNKMAGYLQKHLHVSKGDRVLLNMQNSPQFIIAYYGILRAGAVVVPVNPMNTTEELSLYVEDSASKVAFAGQELAERMIPLLDKTHLKHLIVAAYSEYISSDFQQELHEDISTPRKNFIEENVTAWKDALAANLIPNGTGVTSEDLAALPYTSGSTGRPKGCMHTHDTIQANILSGAAWVDMTADSVCLATLPLFHVTGMVHSMHIPIYCGSTIVLMTRWDKKLAHQLIKQYKCSHWINISTMVVDFLTNDNLNESDFDSVMFIGGGGAPLPKAVGENLLNLTGLRYIEAYGLTETISASHFNPMDHPKLQCLGIPTFGVDARIIDPVSLKELGPNEEGEIIIHGPQVLKGYWRKPEETKKTFITIDDKLFLRTGDIAKYDEDGYFFIVDRYKRMINAAGFKVWPTEVESALYKHPAIEQVCVIGVPDERRGESVKAVVVLRESQKGKVTEDEIIEWSKGQMANYKYPRFVEFVDRLPISGSGKILWRQLQEEELKKRQNLPN
ncbi:long-chain fatty acid--CoA ligase [Bacillus dakarensis]|uniref:long-chain fatty acid--CoA ligase n=1 Tax=Robertmurraya dakarensis TaxID=1926278 RepID=UPI0009826A74|nr:long-chain fatty acid--CoA ligase [Bacillus dakarensis]